MFPRRPSPCQRLCAAEDDDLLMARDIRAMIILIFTLVSAVNQVTYMAAFFLFFSWLVFWFPNARNLVNSRAEMNRCYKYIIILVYLFKYLY